MTPALYVIIGFVIACLSVPVFARQMRVEEVDDPMWARPRKEHRVEHALVAVCALATWAFWPLVPCLLVFGAISAGFERIRARREAKAREAAQERENAPCKPSKTYREEER